MTLSSPPSPPLRPCPACAAPMPASAGPRLEMRTCHRCRTVSAWPLPTAEEAGDYYNSDYAVLDGGVTRDQVERWGPLLERLARATSGRRALEVGSSHGHFLRLASARGWDIAGVELDGRARESHQRQSPGIPAWGSVDEARAAGRSGLDAIVMLHVIEHLPDPAAVLSDLAELLTPGGVLLLTTPNGGGLVRRLAGPAWEWWSPPAHLELFTLAGLDALLARSGFTRELAFTRRGDSTGTASNLLLAPARLARRRLRGPARQSVTRQSGAQRLSRAVNRVLDPPTGPLRQAAYARLLGPELVVLACVWPEDPAAEP